MKKLMILGAIAIMFLMVSNATAVPQKNSESAQRALAVQEKVENFKAKIATLDLKGFLQNLIEALVALVTGILELVYNVVVTLSAFPLALVMGVIQVLVQIPTALITLFTEGLAWIGEFISNLIQEIMDIFAPDVA